MARLPCFSDEGRFEQCDVGLISSDPLKFVDNKPYSERLTAMRAATNLDDALISAAVRWPGRKCGSGTQVHRRQHGERDGEDYPLDREVHCGVDADDHRVGIGRGTHAGGRGQLNAGMAKISSALMRLDERVRPRTSAC